MLARRFCCSFHSHFHFLNIRSRELNHQTCTRLLPEWALRELRQTWSLILFHCTVHPWLKTACSVGRFSSSAAVGPGCFVASSLALQQAALGFSLWPDFSQTNATASFSWRYDLLSGGDRANLNTLFLSVVQFPLVEKGTAVRDRTESVSHSPEENPASESTLCFYFDFYSISSKKELHGQIFYVPCKGLC